MQKKRKVEEQAREKKIRRDNSWSPKNANNHPKHTEQLLVTYRGQNGEINIKFWGQLIYEEIAYKFVLLIYFHGSVHFAWFFIRTLCIWCMCTWP